MRCREHGTASKHTAQTTHTVHEWRQYGVGNKCKLFWSAFLKRFVVEHEKCWLNEIKWSHTWTHTLQTTLTRTKTSTTSFFPYLVVPKIWMLKEAMFSPSTKLQRRVRAGRRKQNLMLTLRTHQCTKTETRVDVLYGSRGWDGDNDIHWPTVML